MTKKYRGNAFAAVHETMQARHEAGGVKKPGGPALRLLTMIQKKGLKAMA